MDCNAWFISVRGKHPQQSTRLLELFKSFMRNVKAGDLVPSFLIGSLQNEELFLGIMEDFSTCSNTNT